MCVRIPRMDNVDIGLFDYDRNNTLYFFILNADEQIYLRYGGRDSVSPDTYLNLNSLELALKKGLELHEQYQTGELKRRSVRSRCSRAKFRCWWSGPSRGGACVECHLIGDFQNLQREQRRNPRQNDAHVPLAGHQDHRDPPRCAERARREGGAAALCRQRA